MTIDCRKYINGLEKSKNTIDFLWNRSQSKTDMAVEFSVSSGVPIVVTCLFVLREYGANTDVYDLLQRLIKFYNYSKIIDFDGVEQIPA